MYRVDVLAHVSAPSTVAQDNRTLFMTQALLNFKSRRTLAVARIGTEPSHEESMDLGDIQLQEGALKRKASFTGNSNHRRSFKRTRTSDNINPPYRNPYHGVVSIEPLTRNSIDNKRPQTAPASSSPTVQVPRTGSERRRAYSDSFHGMDKPMDDQQSDERIDESSEARISSPLERKRITESMSLASMEESSPDREASSSNSIVLRTRKKVSEPSSSTETATMTPPWPSQGLDGARPYSSQPIPGKSPSIVTISSTSSQRRVGDESHRGKDGVGSSRVHLQSSAQDGTQALPEIPFPTIDNLSTEVASPQPQTGSMDHKSHVTAYLQDLSTVARVFRPIKVTRDVKAMERGHWLMDITIAPDEVVQQARSSPTKARMLQSLTDRFGRNSKAQGRMDQFWAARKAGKLHNYDYGDEDLAVGLWTEDEFIDFWNDFSAFVQDGKAGWGVRLARDELISSPQQSNKRRMRVRVFHWGEVMVHIYLAIYVVSEKVSVRIPMQWIAGNGVVIVEMSGKRKTAGHVPVIEKGTGPDARWGLEGS
jgi:hypothetical protein